MTPDLSRRGLLLSSGSLAAVPLTGPTEAQSHDTMPATPMAAPTLWRFFTADQASLVAAMVDRLIPPDAEFTGAVGAGVPQFIDGQLAGAWGSGARLYRLGPFAEGTPEQGYQLPYTPAELYRTSLSLVADWVRGGYGSRFEELDPRLQDEALRSLESGEAGFSELPSDAFFETLLANTVEGFLSDPMYGGNRDMVGWRMVGFPGPYAGYVNLLDRHGLNFNRPPRGIAEALREHAQHHAPTLQR
ncbi:gluconate 2-dehydrogenase subunit 3 family protein [Falsiroseomonas tokyonensis]|uniref:Gluconate 2-dehydrogenase subunit 3 family protein n=1 Tax=Falsiroseomonas tokyonensis TaxID=430521 RepID=A0ABV7BRC1_9PROT|nr:gluconate 2-dehydrogenase subunit 3 family protein [Falsiroseomonas tokyonensis]MBU8536593.1 gluconate 2-dehydrogenase subunit 3 family protein [Falsiroseomonas tokyonensis]